MVFKLGKVGGPARGPGLIFVVPFAQRIRRVSLRIVTMPIQSQGIITKDNVSIDVCAVAYYRVVNRFLGGVGPVGAHGSGSQRLRLSIWVSQSGGRGGQSVWRIRSGR